MRKNYYVCDRCGAHLGSGVDGVVIEGMAWKVTKADSLEIVLGSTARGGGGEYALCWPCLRAAMHGGEVECRETIREDR